MSPGLFVPGFCCPVFCCPRFVCPRICWSPFIFAPGCCSSRICPRLFCPGCIFSPRLFVPFSSVTCGRQGSYTDNQLMQASTTMGSSASGGRHRLTLIFGQSRPAIMYNSCLATGTPLGSCHKLFVIRRSRHFVFVSGAGQMHSTPTRCCDRALCTVHPAPCARCTRDPQHLHLSNRSPGERRTHSPWCKRYARS